eukprot:704576-Prymnesium_polylepis.1
MLGSAIGSRLWRRSLSRPTKPGTICRSPCLLSGDRDDASDAQRYKYSERACSCSGGSSISIEKLSMHLPATRASGRASGLTTPLTGCGRYDVLRRSGLVFGPGDIPDLFQVRIYRHQNKSGMSPGTMSSSGLVLL